MNALQYCPGQKDPLNLMAVRGRCDKEIRQFRSHLGNQFILLETMLPGEINEVTLIFQDFESCE